VLDNWAIDVAVGRLGMPDRVVLETAAGRFDLDPLTSPALSASVFRFGSGWTAECDTETEVSIPIDKS